MIKTLKETEYRVICTECGDEDVIHSTTPEYRKYNSASNFFKAHGWGEGENGNLCPKCYKAMKSSKKV